MLMLQCVIYLSCFIVDKIWSKFISLATLDSILSLAKSGDGYLSEKINLHCRHLSDSISGHLSDTISIEAKIYVDN
jgi:hypothetical protein